MRFVCAVLLFCLVTCQAANYFVSQSQGNDANDGTESTPWQTIAKVNATTFAYGDTIHFKAGDTWRETLVITSGGSGGAPLTFTRYGDGAPPVISGAESITGWSPYATNIYRAPLATETHMVTIDNVMQWKSADLASLSPDQYYWESGYLYLYQTTSLDSFLVEAAIRDNAIKCSTKLYYVNIEQLSLEKTNSASLTTVNSRYWRIEDCTMRFCNSRSQSGAGIQLTLGNNTTIENNVLSYVLGDAIMCWRTLAVTVRGNHISHVYRGVESGGDGIQVASDNPNETDNFIIENNIINLKGTDVGKGCIQQQMGSNGIVRGNRCYYGNYGLGAKGEGLLVENNVFAFAGVESGYEWAAGLLVSDDSTLTGNTYRNNLIYSCTNGMYILDTGYDDLRDAFVIENNSFIDCEDGINCRSPINATFRNNLLVDCTSRALYVTQPQSWTSDYNLFYPEQAGFINYDWSPYDTLTAYQGTGLDSHSLPSDPQLANPALQDFHLLTTSPAADAGMDTGIATDLENQSRPQGSGYAMGALETTIIDDPDLLTAVADAGTQAGNFIQANFGFESTLFVGNSNLEDYQGVAFLTFDPTGIPATVGTATLYLYVLEAGATPAVNSLSVASNSFDESTISYQTQPGAGTIISNWTPVLGTYVSLDVTNAINQGITLGQSVTFALTATGGTGTDSWVRYASRENLPNQVPVIQLSDALPSEEGEVLRYSFNNASLSPNPGIADHLTASDVERIGVTSSTKGSYVTTACNSAGWLDEVISPSKYITFTVTPESGYTLSLSELSFMAGKGTKKDYTPFAVRSSLDGFSADLMSFTIFNTLSQVAKSLQLGPEYQELTGPVTFRFYAGDSFYAHFDEIALVGEAMEILPVSLASFSFSNDDPTPNLPVEPGVAVSDFSRQGVSHSNKGSYVDLAYNCAGFPDLYIDPAKYVECTIGPQTGQTLEIVQLDFLAGKGTKKDVTPFAVRTSLDNFASDLTSFTIYNTMSQVPKSFELPPEFANLTSPVTFRFYAGDNWFAHFDEVEFTGFVH